MTVLLDGFLPVVPMPTPRPRFVCRGRFAQAYSPKAYKDWQEEAARALAALPGPIAPFMGPVRVTVAALIPAPKKTTRVCPGGDVDNYAKGILDAVTKDGRFWRGADQVVSLATTKLWTTPGVRPGYHLTISKA